MNSLKLITAIIAALFPALLIAQDTAIYKAGKPRGSIAGKVVNAKTGEPLAGASVIFPDLKVGGPANSDGVFEYRNIAQGSYLVEVSHVGFKTILETVTLNGDVHKEFALMPSLVEAENVIVTGVSAATSARRTPVPVSIVKKEDLMREASTNLIDAISKQAGVSQLSTGPAISKPIIRGLGYNRLVVVNDGVRQEGQQWGDEHGIEIDEYNVSRAEILKGPASLMYGSDALAGVVNFISVVPTPVNTIRGNLFAAYQSNNRQQGLHADAEGNHNGFIWRVYGSHKAAADYRNKYDGYVFNSKFHEQDFGGHIGLNKAWGFAHLLFSNFDQTLGLIEGERDSATGKFLKLIDDNGSEAQAIATDADFKSTEPNIPKQRIQHLKVTADNSFRVGQSRITFTAGYQRNQRQEFGNVVNPSEKSLSFDLKTINYNLQYHFNETHSWKTTIGVNGMRQENKNRGAEVLIPEYSLFDIGGFVYTQKRFTDLTLSGGVRLDHRTLDSKAFEDNGEVKFTAFQRNYSNVSASAGLSYEASKRVTLKLNVARGFRAPSIPELASNGAHEGTNRFEYGEQNLKSETSLQFDGGVEVGTEHVSLSASVFYNHINNFIYSRKLTAAAGGDSIINQGATAFFAFRFNQNDANLYGIEANLDIHPHPLDWLHIENTFSYVRGMLTVEQDGSKNLPLIPAARLLNEVKVEFLKKGKTVHNMYAKAELDNTFAQHNPFTGFNTETATPAYSLINAGFGAELQHKSKTLFSIFFSANNITDVAYQSHLSRLKYADINNVTGRQGVYNIGRNFSFKLNVPLSFLLSH